MNVRLYRCGGKAAVSPQPDWHHPDHQRLCQVHVSDEALAAPSSSVEPNLKPLDESGFRDILYVSVGVFTTLMGGEEMRQRRADHTNAFPLEPAFRPPQAFNDNFQYHK